MCFSSTFVPVFVLDGQAIQRLLTEQDGAIMLKGLLGILFAEVRKDGSFKVAEGAVISGQDGPGHARECLASCI